MLKKFFGGLATLLLLASLFVWTTASLAATHQQTPVTNQNVIAATWSGWESLDGVLPKDEAPTAVSWGSNRIGVLARGTDHALWYRQGSGFWNGSRWSIGGWSPWQSLGGILTTVPVAVSGGTTVSMSLLVAPIMRCGTCGGNRR